MFVFPESVPLVDDAMLDGIDLSMPIAIDGVPVGTLGDFIDANIEALDESLIVSLAALAHCGTIELDMGAHGCFHITRIDQ